MTTGRINQVTGPVAGRGSERGVVVAAAAFTLLSSAGSPPRFPGVATRGRGITLRPTGSSARRRRRSPRRFDASATHTSVHLANPTDGSHSRRDWAVPTGRRGEPAASRPRPSTRGRRSPANQTGVGPRAANCKQAPARGRTGNATRTPLSVEDEDDDDGCGGTPGARRTRSGRARRRRRLSSSPTRRRESNGTMQPRREGGGQPVLGRRSRRRGTCVGTDFGGELRCQPLSLSLLATTTTLSSTPPNQGRTWKDRPSTARFDTRPTIAGNTGRTLPHRRTS